MEILRSTQLAIPLFQVILLLILSTIALLAVFLRLALFINLDCTPQVGQNVLE